MNIKRVTSTNVRKKWTSDPESYVRRSKRHSLDSLAEDIANEVGLKKMYVLENLFRAIKGLPEPQRTVVYEVCVYRKTMVEYTYQFGMPIQRVDKYFSEGKKKLIEYFKNSKEEKENE